MALRNVGRYSLHTVLAPRVNERPDPTNKRRKVAKSFYRRSADRDAARHPNKRPFTMIVAQKRTGSFPPNRRSATPPVV